MLVSLLRLLAVGALAVTHAAPLVTLPNGASVTGSVVTSVAGSLVNVFRGIPYAEPPKRWKPATLKPLKQSLNATTFGNICYGVAVIGPIVDPQSEDCLFLNVYAPVGATSKSKLPVMVWIHGGGFLVGSSKTEEGQNLIAAAKGQLVVVTLNYRLGVFGFFSNPQLLAEGQGANFGLRDQAVAFEWVKRHIAFFGGNPNDITAFGESAGSISVAMHMLSGDGNQKLFHRAIMQSGTYATTHDTLTPAMQETQKMTIAQGVGCTNATDVMTCLRAADAGALMNVSSSLKWFSTVDGVFMKEMPAKRLLDGKVSQVPSIIGTNADEGWLFALEAAEASQYDAYVRRRFPKMTEAEYAKLAELYPADAFLTAQHRVSEIFGDTIFVCPSEQFSLGLTKTESYRYRFNYTSTEFGYPLVIHAKDVPYVFNQVALLPTDDVTKQVVSYFQTYWTNFALTGSPNGQCSKNDGPTQSSPKQNGQPLPLPLLPATGKTIPWPLFSSKDKQQLVIQPTLALETMGTQSAGHEERCAFWWQVEQRTIRDVAFI